MIRDLLRVATLHQVLKVTPPDAATQSVTAEQGGHNWALWEFDREAVAVIGDQSKVDQSTATVGDLHSERLAWMTHIPGELEQHATLVSAFRKGDFLDPPVLIHHPPVGWDYHVRDGAHRIHAAYEHMATAPHRRLRIYWNRLAWP